MKSHAVDEQSFGLAMGPATLSQGALAVVWQTAEDGRILERNSSWGAFTGQEFSEYAGWGWLQAIHPSDRERIALSWRAATEGVLPFGAEYRLRRADGQYRFVRAQGTAVRSGSLVAEWVGMCVDITDTIEAQQALERTQLRFRFLDELGQATRELTQAADVMQITARLLGEYLRATRCAYADVDHDSNMFTIRNDWTRAGVASSAGRYTLDLFGPQATSSLRRGENLVVRDVDSELGPQGGADMFNAIGIKAIVCAGLVKNGRLVAMMAVHHATPRHWTEEEIGLTSEVVDRCWAHIERVRDHEILREQDRRKDAFLATLAHELRNPLAPIKYALALMERSQDPSRMTAARNTISRQVSQMARLIDDLLDLSRISRGLIKLQMAPVRVMDVLAEAEEATRPLIEERGHTLQVERPGPELLVDGDSMRLVQMLENLLTNAAKYTPAGGKISVRAYSDDEVHLEVSDTGLGVPLEDQHRLFEMFTQLEHTVAASGGGLGIGLALVKELSGLHGGTVSVRSAGINQGATFTLSLPRVAGLQPVTRSHPALPEATPANQRRVFVVEDNSDGRTSLVQLLQVLGHDVESAADGVEALHRLESWVPDVVLLDLGLPGLSGIDVCRELRRRSQFAHTRIIALTGWGAAHDRASTREAGFDSHLTKPVEVDALLHEIASSTAAPRIAGS